jgi:hypothetical protein
MNNLDIRTVTVQKSGCQADSWHDAFHSSRSGHFLAALGPRRDIKNLTK